MTHQADHSYGWSQETGDSLLDKLKTDLKAAMRQKDSSARDAIRQVMAEFPKLTVPIVLESGKKTTRLKKPEEISNDDILDIIKGLVKSEQSVLEVKGETSSDYLRILASYLPKGAGRDEIRSWIEGNIDFNDFKSPMQAMGPIMAHFGKNVDGSMVREILQEFLKRASEK